MPKAKLSPALRSLIVIFLSVSLASIINVPEVALIVSLIVLLLSSVRRVVIVLSVSSLTLPFVKKVSPDSVKMVRAFCALKVLLFIVKVSTPTVLTVVSRVVEKLLNVELMRTALSLSMLPPEIMLST